MFFFKGYTEVLIASILFGFIGIFVKLITHMPLGSIIFFRLLFGLAVIVLFLFFCGRLNEIKLKEKRMFILLLGIFQAGAMFSYFTSIRYTTVSIAVLLLYTAPVYITLLSPVILKEHINRQSLLALAVSLAGVVMIINPRNIFLDNSGLNLTGFIMGLISGLFYALYILTSRYLRHYYTGTAQASWALIITFFVFIPYSGAVSPGVLLDNLYILVLFGLIPTAMAIIFYLNGLRHVRAQNAGIIGLLEPVSAVVFGFIILGEPISMTTLAGGGFILLGALIVSSERPIETVHE